ncbi:hypothetical protein PSPO01_00905 [Paraphaeosphaeria sporulosa]
MVIVTINNYDAPAQPHHPFSRQCPNFRLPWSTMASSYDLTIPSRSEKARRLSFILVQALQAAYLVFTPSLPTSPLDMPYLLASILFFFFVAWNLHLIVSMKGERVLFGRSFGRKWFDGFLMGCVGAYACVLVGRVVGGWSTGMAWLVLDLAIFGVAWVSTWEEGGVILG